MPRPPAAAGLSIQGTVVDAWGQPFLGAQVSGSRPIEGETISTLPCPEDTPTSVSMHEEDEDRTFPPTRSPPWCLPWTDRWPRLDDTTQLASGDVSDAPSSDCREVRDREFWAVYTMQFNCYTP